MSDASKQFSEQAYLIVLKGGDEENHEDVLFSLGPSPEVALKRAMEALGEEVPVEDTLDIDLAEDACSPFEDHLAVLSRVHNVALKEAREEEGKKSRYEALQEAFEIVSDQLQILPEDDAASAIAKELLTKVRDDLRKKVHTAADLFRLAKLRAAEA